MRYVILRDDDTNALTPRYCLERLYRPFLDRGFPVNLATIPDVNVNTRRTDGALEGYLLYHNGGTAEKVRIGSNSELVNYLRDNPGYRIVQHGCHHDPLEFGGLGRAEAARRIEHGARALKEAGLDGSRAFVAPYDKLSPGSLLAVSAHFGVLSTGWFELRRLPYSWWPRFAVKKMRGADHWRVGETVLLSHPGCMLSYHRPCHEILDTIVARVESRTLTVLVTHWWEYFREGRPDEELIGVLHETAAWLGSRPDVKTISFDELEQIGGRLLS